jgi:hypothetical protein
MRATDIGAAMRQARCEVLADDGTHYCAISICPGVWENETTLDATLIEPCSVIVGWIGLGMLVNDPLPDVDGDMSSTCGNSS